MNKTTASTTTRGMEQLVSAVMYQALADYRDCPSMRPEIEEFLMESEWAHAMFGEPEHLVKKLRKQVSVS